MGSSSVKKHKKDKKHKRRSDNDEIDLTAEGNGSDGQRRHKHKRHKEHKERHKHKHRSRERQRENEKVNEVIAVEESDSDSSDCVEVPVDIESAAPKRSTLTEREVIAPPPPQLSRRELENVRDRDKKREKPREKEIDKDREKDRDRERERFERERARERDRYERERERREREGERREREEREREKEQRERYEREREREWDRDRERERERDRDRDRDRERERDRVERVRHRDRTEFSRSERDRTRGRSRSRSKSAIPENGAGDVLSVEETNRLRAKLGLKPLEVDTVTTSSVAADDGRKGKMVGVHKDLSKYKDEWGEFMHKPADNLAEKAEAEKIREKLKQRREKRNLEERLARIRTLGESDEEVDDVSKWVQRNKAVVDVKKEAEKRSKMFEEMDAEIEESVVRTNYGNKDLKGLKVEHDMDEFTEGKTIILTLKDQEVLNEEDGDTLVNVNLIDDERYRKNVVNKKLNPLSYGYNVYEEQYDLLGNPIERNVLEKYDEDLDGKILKKKAFVLGENLDVEREQKRKLLEIKTKLAGKKLETLADAQIQLASDTLTEAEMAKFKKPKKKVKKFRQKLKADDLLPLNNESSLENHLGSRHAGNSNDSFKIDEEDANELERMLTKARKLKQKDNLIKKTLPVDIVAIKQEIKTEPNEPIQLRSADGNIILNATAEFCRTLGDIPTYGMAGNRIQDGAEIMDYEGNSSPEHEKREILELDIDKQESSHGTWNSVNPDEVMQPADLDNIADGDLEERAILDEEPDVGAGVANALRLALSKGYLEKEELNRPSNSKMAHLQAKNYSIEDKNVGEEEKFGRRDRFHSGPIMDFRDKDGFKPNVKLEYIDDSGRILNLKEAFRYLSHKFHGKGPGKNKIEKRLKKMEQEGLMKTMSSTDTPLGTLTMLQQKQKETKTPYVVLSGGKQAANGFGPQTLSKFK